MTAPLRLVGLPFYAALGVVSHLRETAAQWRLPPAVDDEPPY